MSGISSIGLLKAGNLPTPSPKLLFEPGPRLAMKLQPVTASTWLPELGSATPRLEPRFTVRLRGFSW